MCFKFLKMCEYECLVCMYVCTYISSACLVPEEVRRQACWELKLGPQQKQQVLLATEPSLQPRLFLGQGRPGRLQTPYLAEDDLEFLNLLLPPLKGICHHTGGPTRGFEHSCMPGNMLLIKL